MSTSQAPKKKVRKDRLVGQLLAGKYKIIKKIGEGGMGSVYIATQEPIDRKVAVKVLLGKLAEDEIAVKRFEQEARAISKMQHPNTVTIYDFGHTAEEDDERLYIVMEYLKGRTLTQLLRKEKVINPIRAAKIMRQVCASLSDAHAAGIIHRDLKPDNIFLTEVGGDPDWVKVLDFGVAKLADSEGAGTLTQTGMIFGTPKYMSPEQAEGRPIDYRADIYALGVVMYELLVGRPPFVADTPVGLLLKHISEPPAPFAKIRPDLTIDPRIEAIVMKSLDKRPDGRQQAVSDLAAELEMFERTASGPVYLPGTGTHPTPGVGGLPTEVVPGQNPSNPFTPSGLQSPNAVPSHLSLGGQPATQHMTGGTQAAEHMTQQQQPGSAQYQSADAMATAAQGAMPGSVQMTAPGLTHPTPAMGGAVETLGGISHEISGPFPGHQKKSSRSPLLLGGVGLLVAAVALAGFAFISQEEEAATVAPIAAPDKKTPPPPPAVAPEDPKDPDEAVVAKDPDPEPDKNPSRDRRPRRPRASPPPPPPPPAPSRTVRFDFTSEPAGALVTLNGQEQGRTPFHVDYPRGEDVLTFVFAKDGYETTRSVATPSFERTVRATLKKEAVAKTPTKTRKKKCADGKPPPCRRRAPPPPPPPSEKIDDPLGERVSDLK
ncbi:MAG: serine/threonine-protein kinase [Deltaproteobacteria bacterium]